MSAAFLSPGRQAAVPAQPVTLTSYGTFEQMLQVADMLSRSPLVPKSFRGQPGSVMLALNMSQRLMLDPFMVMQNIYDVNGRPALSGQFAIALLNRSRKYRRIEYRYVNGKDYTGGMQVVGHRVDDPEDKCPDIGTAVTPAMVQAEAWGNKWRTMPEQMYRYRAAAFFARAFCPEELMGMSTLEELEDEPGGNPGMRNVSGCGLAPAAAPAAQAVAAQAAGHGTALPAPAQDSAGRMMQAPAQEVKSESAAPAQKAQEEPANVHAGCYDAFLDKLNEAGAKFGDFRRWAKESGVTLPPVGSQKSAWDEVIGNIFDDVELTAGLDKALFADKNN